MGSNEDKTNYYNEYIEKQQLFVQRVQKQNTSLTSQLELYKERVRILENIKGDNNYLNEFLEADRQAKHFNQQAQSQFIRDQDIIRDLKQQRDKLDLALQAKNKDLENVVCKMGKSTETLQLLTNEQKAFRDNLRKSGLGYNGPYVLSQAYAKIPKLYRAYELCDKNEQLHVFDSEDTLEDAEKSQLKMNEFQKDEKVQELKIKPIDYRKLNNLYDDFVPQKELSAEQTYFPTSFISSEKVSSKTKPSMASMPSANPMLVDLNEMENNRFKRDVKEMKDVFVSVENDLDETFKQNELLKDQLLEASLAEDIKNLVITSCVEIRNKVLHDETERISKASKDVSNESKTTDTVCNDAFEVTQELSKRIVELEKDLSKFEAKSIAFEIALQHKSRENNSLKTLQKENENFMASLQIENAHLKQTYKDLFDSVQRSRVETNHCDEVKVKVSFDEIQKLFDKEMKRVNTFVAMSSEKQKVEKEKESEEVDEVELKKILVIKNDEDIAIDAIPLATKLPMIVDYKLHKEGIFATLGQIKENVLSCIYSINIEKKNLSGLELFKQNIQSFVAQFNELPQIIKLLIKTKVPHEGDCELSRKYEYVGQKLQKTNQDEFTVKNDDMKRSQRQRQKENGKIKIKITRA
ncbi:hypothetical protein Tco_0290139 [Tanacetum coccineum]